MNHVLANDTNNAPVFAEHGRKGISYDWQSLLADDALSTDAIATLRALDFELELAATCAE